jgi:hypothetical protein
LKFRNWILILIPLSAALPAIGDQSWKDKPPAEWTEDDAKQILTDSPWAKTVKPEIDKSANTQRRSGGGSGIGVGGIGLPGVGMGRRRRNSTGADDSPGNASGNAPAEVLDLKLRWESALPIRDAELKGREVYAPDIDEDHYAIAVYGVPAKMAAGDSKSLAEQLKKQASLKREGKKDLTPSSVEIYQRDEGPVIVYLFPRSKEITRQDKRIEFEAQIARLKLTQAFILDEMVYREKLEL